MIVHRVEQNSLAWLQLHVGIPTASGLDQLVDSNFDFRKGEMPKTYMHKKLAEKWRGQPLIQLGSSGSFSTEQGMILEEEALPWFELEYDQPIDRVGFLTTDDASFGCSPDGLLVGKDCGLELKAPAAHTHVKYLIENRLPPEYAAQVHGGMFVTGFPQWVFCSYRRNFPPLVLTIMRNEEVIQKIAIALARFNANLTLAHANLTKHDEDSDDLRLALLRPA